MSEDSRYINFDTEREKRIGIAEAVFAEGKSLEEFRIVLEDLRPLIPNSLFLFTRMNSDHFNLLKDSRFPIRTVDTNYRTAIVGEGDFKMRFNDPQVLIVSGGTSDLAIVEEISITLSYHGIPSIHAVDIGVANLERLKIALQKIQKFRHSLKIIIAVAGFEGALFSVMNSVTKLPVIAVPSPQGYGLGGKGEAAMLSALQSCSSGVVTVNIGNGFGAAMFAIKLLNHLNLMEEEFGSIFQSQ
ncbi:MAG: nickel pincer cofactor biosynthesis protein LarB [Methanobacteriota archaeon]|nr:MAG: nickel pincer cofactor biosynthesis protein LarB [Euryarchaeota archaeon]